MPRKFFINKEFEVKDIMSLIKKHRTIKAGYTTLQDYYLGRHDVLLRSFSDINKPNNKLVNNFAKLITDTSTAYFLGEPVSYICKEEKFIESITDINRQNFSRDVDSELGKMSSIYGHAFEVHWLQEGEHRFKAVSPMDLILCYSNDLAETTVCGILYQTFKDATSESEKTLVQVYTKDEVLEFEAEGEKALSPPSVTPHYFGDVPIIEYLNNEERQGDFENVITLIDAYNLSTSDSVNDIEYWNDAYLLLRNLNATDQEDIDKMKENRVLLVDGDGDASFITKNIQDKHIENIKDRLTMDIHKFSQTPDLNDEQFATNLSGVAIKYKLLGLENKTAIKERKFTTALIKRMRLIANVLKIKGKAEALPYVEPVFTRNIPANLVELADMVAKIRGLVSDETLMAQLPFVIDIDDELNRIALEREDMMNYDMSNPFNTPSNTPSEPFTPSSKKTENPTE